MIFLEILATSMLILWSVNSITIYLLLRAMWKNPVFEKLAPNTYPLLETYAGGYDRWASHHRFVFVGTYRAPGWLGGAVAVWRHQDHPVFFSVTMVGPKAGWDFTSEFTRDQTLTTANAYDGAPIPRGSYRQYFSDASLDELWDRHRQAHVALVKTKRVVPWSAAREPSLSELMTRSLIRARDHLCAIPWWWARTTWWFFVTRRRLNNKPLSFVTASASGS